MRVFFITGGGINTASSRLRVYQYLPFLKKSGIQFDIYPVRDSFSKKHGIFKKLMVAFYIWRADVVFVQKTYIPDYMRKMFKRWKKKLICDLDDAIFSLPHYKKGGDLKKSCEDLFAYSSCVIVGNEYLKKWMLKRNKNVDVIPTPIDTNVYSAMPKPFTEAPVIIGWIGSTANNEYLNLLPRVLGEISKKYNVALKIISGSLRFLHLDNFKIPATFREWHLETELNDVRSFDIGIMPLVDNEWTRGKCAFKALLYMSLGIPVVCSPVGVNKEVIKDGVNGYLVTTRKEWVEKLGKLIEDPNLRCKMGTEGRKTVEEKFSLKVNAPLLKNVLEREVRNGGEICPMCEMYEVDR